MRTVEIAIKAHDDGEAEGHSKEARYEIWIFFKHISHVERSVVPGAPDSQAALAP